MTFKAAIPVLPCRDVDAAARWYKDVLGFAVGFTWGSPAAYAGLERDATELHLRAEGMPSAAYVAILLDDVDAYHAEVLDRGAEVTEPPADRPYGMRDFTVRTPEGHLLSFGQALAE